MQEHFPFSPSRIDGQPDMGEGEKEERKKIYEIAFEARESKIED